MATAMVMEWPGVTEEQYDRVMELLGLDESPPQGGIFHVAGPGSGGWRVVDIWESQDHFERFAQERLMPAVQQAGLKGEPQTHFFPVHNLFAPGVEEMSQLGRSSLPVG